MGAQDLVLDAWPVVEWLKLRQPVLATFEQLLLDANAKRVHFAMSRINYGEVLYGIHKIPGWTPVKKQRALAAFAKATIEIVSATDERVDEAIELKSTYNISYADAFAAALSIERNIPLVTGDKEFRKLESDGLLKLHWLGA